MTNTQPHPSSSARRFPLFLGLALILGFDLLVLGPYALVHFHDSFDHEALHWLAQGRIFREFGLTGWYPDYCGGIPSFIGHRAPYYPLSVLSGFLPLWAVYSLVRLTLMTLAGYGMFRLLRDFFRAPQACAVIGAAAMLLSSLSFGVYLVFNYAFPLLFLWSLDVFDGRGGLPSRLAKTGAFLLLALCSYPVLSVPYFPALHLFMVLAFAREPGRTGRRVLGVFLLWIGYALLFAPYLFSLVDYLPLIQRSYSYQYEGLAHGLAYVLKTTGHILHEDQPAFALFLFGLPGLFSSARLRLALLFVLGPALVAALSHSPFLALVAGTFLVKMDLGNILRLMQFTVPLFAALALAERFAARPGRREWVQALAAVGVCGLLGPAYEVLSQAMVLGAGLAALALVRPPAGGAAGTPLSGRGRTLALAALGLALAGSVMFTRQILLIKHSHVPFHKGYGSHPELAELVRKEKGRPLRAVCVDLHPSVAQYAGFEVVEQKGVLFNKYYKQVFKGVVRPLLKDPRAEAAFDRQWYQLFSTMIDIHRNYFLEFNPGAARQATDWNLPLLESLNVKYVLSSKPIAGLEAHSLSVMQADGASLPLDLLKGTAADRSNRLPLWIYQLRWPMERGYLARPRVLPGPGEVLAAMEGASREDLRATAFLAAGDLPGSGGLGAPGGPSQPGPLGRVRCSLYTPDRLVFEGEAAAPCLLVVSNNHDPHWSATRNGQAVPLLRANHAFQAVPLEPGPFRVELAYAHPLVWRLHWVSLAGLVLILVPALRRREQGGPPAAPAGSPASPAAAGTGPDRAAVLAAPLGALAMTALWAVPFYFTVGLKHAGSQNPVLYVLWTGAVMGLFMGWWARAAEAGWDR